METQVRKVRKCVDAQMEIILQVEFVTVVIVYELYALDRQALVFRPAV